MRTKYFISVIIGVLSLQFCLAQTSEEKANFELSKNLTIYHNILKELNLLYVDSVDNGKLINKGITEMLKGLDPYTVYIPEKEMAGFKTQTTGEYGGIGTLIQKRDSCVMISQIFEGFPADKAGVRSGDRIIALDGENMCGKSMEKVTAVMKGKPNTSFEMAVERPFAKQKIHKLKITREKIQLDCVPFDTLLNKNIGYLVFTNFTDKAGKRVKETVKKLQKGGAKSLIIDLRGNPGGLLSEAVKVVNLFTKKSQLVVATKGKISRWDRNYQTTKQPLDTQIPIVVLVNSGSASAAEIVAGTLQDLDRAVVMGTRSFGKGLVQTTRPVGYNGRLKVTTSKYYIPSGRCIQALDYSHKNKDGSVGHVPDSLITAFKTKNGRTVYDGGGIMPDIEHKQEKYSSLITQLILQNQISDFATFYANTKTKPAKEFVLDDTIFQEFVHFVEKSAFKYKSEEFEAFEKLKKILEKNQKQIALGDLEKQLSPQLQKDLLRNKKEITNLLEYEITMRFFYQRGAYAQGVRSDKLIEKAVELLEDIAHYRKILSGEIPCASSKKPKFDTK